MIAASTQSNLFQSSRSAQMAWFNFLLEILRERPLLFLYHSVYILPFCYLTTFQVLAPMGLREAVKLLALGRSTSKNGLLKQN